MSHQTKNFSACHICFSTENLIFCDGACCCSFCSRCIDSMFQPPSSLRNIVSPSDYLVAQSCPEYRCYNCLTHTRKCWVCASSADTPENPLRSCVSCNICMHLKCLCTLYSIDPASLPRPFSFECPGHKCAVCTEECSSTSVSELRQYYTCYRCLRSFHDTCQSELPITRSNANFEDYVYENTIYNSCICNPCLRELKMKVPSDASFNADDVLRQVNAELKSHWDGSFSFIPPYQNIVYPTAGIPWLDSFYAQSPHVHQLFAGMKPTIILTSGVAGTEADEAILQEEDDRISRSSDAKPPAIDKRLLSFMSRFTKYNLMEELLSLSTSYPILLQPCQPSGAETDESLAPLIADENVKPAGKMTTILMKDSKYRNSFSWNVPLNTRSSRNCVFLSVYEHLREIKAAAVERPAGVVEAPSVTNEPEAKKVGEEARPPDLHDMGPIEAKAFCSNLLPELTKIPVVEAIKPSSRIATQTQKAPKLYSHQLPEPKDSVVTNMTNAWADVLARLKNLEDECNVLRTVVARLEASIAVREDVLYGRVIIQNGESVHTGTYLQVERLDIPIATRKIYKS